MNIRTQPPYQGHSTVGRFWYNLGSATMVRLIFLGMVVYLLLIGGLVLGYAKVQSCLANYSDEAAASTAARTAAAADDRALNARQVVVDQSDRARIRANNEVLLELIRAILAEDQAAAQTAIRDVARVNQESSRIFAKNEEERTAIATQRADIEARRAAAPPPPPPSETC